MIDESRSFHTPPLEDPSDSRFPRLYLPGQFNHFFNMRLFIFSLLHGIFSSLVVFFIPFGAFSMEVS